MMYWKQGMWEEPKHHTKECGYFLPPACGPGIARHRGRRKPSRASSASSHGRGDPVWGPTGSRCMLAVEKGKVGAGAADGDAPRPPYRSDADELLEAVVAAGFGRVEGAVRVHPRPVHAAG